MFNNNSLNGYSFLLKAKQKCEEAKNIYVDIYGREHNSTAAAIQQIGKSFSNVLFSSHIFQQNI